MIRNRMKVILAERDMSVKELAEKSGMHYTTALRYCRGDQKNVSLRITEQVCKALRINICDIFRYEP